MLHQDRSFAGTLFCSVLLLAGACARDLPRAADAGAEPPEREAATDPEDSEEPEEEPFDAGRSAPLDPCATRACRVRWLRGLGGDVRYPNTALSAARFTDDGSLVVAGSAVAGGVIGAPPFLQLRGTPDHGTIDSFVVTFSASGAAGAASVFGQALGDSVSDMALADDGERVLVGYSGVTSTGSSSGSDVDVVRLSASGELRWRRTFGSSRVTCSNCSDESAQRVVLGPDGTSYVFGRLNAAAQLDALALAGQPFALALSKTGEALWSLPLTGSVEQVLLWQGNLYVAAVEFERAASRDQIKVAKIALDGKLLWQATWSGSDPTLIRLRASGLAIDPLSQQPLLFATELISGNRTEYGKTYAINFDPETGTGEGREVWRNGFIQLFGVHLLPDGEWLSVGREVAGKSGKVHLQFWSPEFLRVHSFWVGDDRADVQIARASVSKDGEIAVFGSVGTGTVFEPPPIFSAGGSAVQARDLSFVFLLER